MTNQPAPELSRMVEIIRVNQVHKIKASEAELAAVAERLDLPALGSLEAELTIKRGRGDLIHVTGELKASLSQTCVVSLEDFPVTVTEAVDADFTDSDIAPDPEDPEAPEPVVNGKIDLGELVVQCLSLALDPFPRKPGVEFAGYDK